MGIFLRQSHNVKPVRWGSPADVQYSIWRNLEDIYGCNHESEVLIMPGFWGFPLLDYSKYGNHGTNHGATYKDGSLDFDGEDDYVDISSVSIASSVNKTISMWVNPSSLSTSDFLMDSQTGRLLIALRDTGSIDTIAFYDGSWKETGVAADLATWQYLSFVFGGTTAKIYKNKNQIGGNIAYTQRAIGGATILGGNFNLGTINNVDGIIDEVRISNVARSADQIGLFYENPYGLYRRVAKPIWSIPAAPSLYIPQIIMF